MSEKHRSESRHRYRPRRSAEHNGDDRRGLNDDAVPEHLIIAGLRRCQEDHTCLGRLHRRLGEPCDGLEYSLFPSEAVAGDRGHDDDCRYAEHDGDENNQEGVLHLNVVKVAQLEGRADCAEEEWLDHPPEGAQLLLGFVFAPNTAADVAKCHTGYVFHVNEVGDLS